jgi:O-antigen ligase
LQEAQNKIIYSASDSVNTFYCPEYQKDLILDGCSITKNMAGTKRNISLDKILVLILFLIIPLIRTNKTLDPELLAQYCSLGLILLIYWLISMISSKSVFIRNRFVSYFLIACAVFVLNSIISLVISPNKTDAIFLFSKYLLFLILVITFLFAKEPRNLFDTLSRVVLILGLIIIIPGYYQFISLLKENQLIIPAGTYNIFSIFPHRNLFSEILFLTIPFAIFQYFSPNKFWRYLAILHFSLALLLLIILSNRGTWLALIACGGIILMLAFLTDHRSLFKKTRIFFAVNALVILITGYFICMGFSDTSSLKEHSLNTFDFKQGSTKDRLELWTRTLKLIDEKPVFGGGLGSWKINVLQFGSEGLASESNPVFYQRPHNDFLWIAAEQGLTGLCIYLILFSAILVRAIRLLFKDSDPQLRSILYVILAVTTGYLVFSFFSFPKERIVQNIFLFAVWGIFLNILNSSGNQVSPVRIHSGWFCIIPLLLSGMLVEGSYRLKGEKHAKAAILAKKESDLRRCIREIKKAKSWAYQFDETSTPLDWYPGLSYYKLKEYSKALNYFIQAYKSNPYHIYVLNDYACCLTKLGQNKKAAGLFRKAIVLSPGYTEAKLNLCALCFNQNEMTEAFNILKSIDTGTSTDRYQKTVIVLVRRIIDDYTKIQEPNNTFLNLYKKRSNDYNFYKEILSYAIQNKTPINKIIDNYINQTAN